MADKVLELVVFKLREDVTREEFLATNPALSEWARQQPGFVSRERYAELRPLVVASLDDVRARWRHNGKR